MSKLRLDAMLSSTSLDLPEHRKQADDAAHRAGFYVVKMETLTAKFGADAISVSMSMVEEAEVYIGIFGLRYGYRPSDPRNPNDISITEMEYRRAKELGMPILIFIMHDEHPAPDTTGMNAKDARKITDAFYERDPRSEEKLEMLKAELKSGIVGFFKSPEDLRTQVLQALSDPDLKAAALGYHEKHRASKPESEPKAPASKIPYPPKLFAFPSYSDQNALFVGRKQELKQLDEWAKPEGKKAMLLIDAIGGMGKSALAWKWLMDKAVPFDGAFWYSFYEGGADMRECVRYALAYVTRQDPDELKGRELPKMLTELENALKQGRYLLILDGLERVLLAYHRWDAAQMQDDSVPEERDHRACTDPQDADVLKRLLACHPSRILITSRLLPSALEDMGKVMDGLEYLQLRGLSPTDARQFWKNVGISWSDEGRLDKFIGQFGRHSLLLKVLAGYIAKDRRAQANFDVWYDIHGVTIELYDNLIAKRHHILEMAYKGLSDEAKKVLSQIAILGNAADLDTLSVFNPYFPPLPEPGEEDNQPVVAPEPQAAEEPKKEKTPLEILEEILAGASAEKEVQEKYQKRLAAFRKSPEYKGAIARFDRLLQELEERGLLWWDKDKAQYDLHPVVRGYAFEQLAESERPASLDKIYNHFEEKDRDFDADTVQSLRDLQNTLVMYNTLIMAEKFDAAQDLFSRRLSDVLIYGGLALYRKAYELLLPFFPNGLTELPNLSDKQKQAYVLGWMGSALYMMNRDEEALQVKGLRLKLELEAQDKSSLGIALANYSLSLGSHNQLAQSLRARQYKYTIAILKNDTEEIAVSNYYLLAAYTDLGRWEEADAAYAAFCTSPSDDWQVRIDITYAESLLYRGETAEKVLEALAKAESLNETHKNPFARRVLKRLKGEVLLQIGNTGEAIKLFSEAIRMANESGFSYGLAWGGLACAYIHAGNQQEALRIVNEEETDSHSAAYVYWKTGQFELAREEALKNYTAAWAQGEPYVWRYGLERVRALLKEMAVDEPQLPVWDESKYEPFPHEEEVKAYIEELRKEKEAADRQAEERQRKIDAGEILEDNAPTFDFSDLDESDES